MPLQTQAAEQLKKVFDNAAGDEGDKWEALHQHLYEKAYEEEREAAIALLQHNDHVLRPRERQLILEEIEWLRNKS